MNKHCLKVIVFVILLLPLFALNKVTAQIINNDIIIRSGYSFNNYSEKSQSLFQSYPDPAEIHYNSYHESSFYFTPGIGKLLGNGYYFGIQSLIGKSQSQRNIIAENLRTIHAYTLNTNRYGGGLLARKYFLASRKFSPFVGLSTSFFNERGTKEFSSGYSEEQSRNYFSTEIHLGGNYQLSSRFGIEAYYSPGNVFWEKRLGINKNYKPGMEFGKIGQEISFGISYHLRN